MLARRDAERHARRLRRYKRLIGQERMYTRKGSAMLRPPCGTRTSGMAESPRRPLALTKTEVVPLSPSIVNLHRRKRIALAALSLPAGLSDIAFRRFHRPAIIV